MKRALCTADDEGLASRDIGSVARAWLRRTGAGLTAAGVLAACGGSAQAIAHPSKPATTTETVRLSAATCNPSKVARAVRLVLSDLKPIPGVSMSPGTAVKVLSSFHHQQMTFPAARPATAVCELSRSRASSGAATVTYRVLKATTITFDSSYTHPSALADPAMFGEATVTRPRRLVRIPDVENRTVQRGYAALHRSGVSVTVAPAFVLHTLANPADQIVQLSPHAGQVVPAGSAVSLKVGCPRCGLGSPAVPTPVPAYLVPNFVGKPLSSASAWIRHKVLYLTTRVGPLRGGDASTFYDNYRITRQSPAPGSVLRLGVGHRKSATSGSFSPTPLVIWLTQKR